MLTDSKVDVDGMTNVTESTDSSTPMASSSTSTSSEMTTEVPTTNMSSTTETNVMGENVDEDLTTTPQSEEAFEDDTTTTNEANGTDETTDDDENENITTVASTRKRRGRLGRGLRGKHRRDKKQSSPSTYVAPKNRAINRRRRSYEILDYENEFHLEEVTQYTTSLRTTSITPTTSKSSSLSSHHAYHEHNHHHHQPSSTENPIHTPRSTAAEKRRINNHKDLFENVNSDTIEHIFYINEYETVRVPYKIYDTVMKYAYINSLQSSFLEIDLDSEYYNLIIIIPDFQDGLNTLTSKLRSHPASTLRFIRNSMDFHWIKTIVPKFHVKGNTILTSDLQNVCVATQFRFSHYYSQIGFYPFSDGNY
jgi:hypothetical protein